MLGRLVNHAPFSKRLDTPFAGITITADSVDLVSAKTLDNLFDRRFRRKWRTLFSDYVEHRGLAFLMADCQRERIARATAWINKCRIPVHAIERPLFDAGIGGRLDGLAGDEALD